MVQRFKTGLNTGSQLSVRTTDTNKPVLIVNAVIGADPKLVEQAMKMIEYMFGPISLEDIDRDFSTLHLRFETPEAAIRFNEFLNQNLGQES